MKLSLRLLLLLPFIFIMVGCPADDEPTLIQSRPYLEVYNEDIAEIEDFMESHYITVDANYNVSFTKITPTTPGSPIFDGLDTSTNQNNPAKPLKFKTISKEGVAHKLYYLKLNEGLGSNPTRLDSVFTSYKGYKTDLSSFDAATSPTWFQLQDVIQGWQEVFPEFKSSNGQTINTDGTITFNNFGAGIMFVPSGLAYYGQNAGTIGSYTPIIFTFKLMNVRYKDHDGDKILSKDEYGGPTSGSPLDTDGDGKPNYADFDDDNDGILTKEEIRRTQNVTGWYPFNGAAQDDPATIGIDESKGIPSCSGNFTSPTRIRKHLDASCQ